MAGGYVVRRVLTCGFQALLCLILLDASIFAAAWFARDSLIILLVVLFVLVIVLPVLFGMLAAARWYPLCGSLVSIVMGCVALCERIGVGLCIGSFPHIPFAFYHYPMTNWKVMIGSGTFACCGSELWINWCRSSTKRKRKRPFAAAPMTFELAKAKLRGQISMKHYEIYESIADILKVAPYDEVVSNELFSEIGKPDRDIVIDTLFQLEVERCKSKGV